MSKVPGWVIFCFYIILLTKICLTHVTLINNLLSYRRFLTPLQQTTFENIVAKVEIAHKEQFNPLPQYFQLNLKIILSLIDSFHIFAYMLSKSYAADLLYE